MRRVNLPAGAWADLRDKEELTVAGRRHIRSISVGLVDVLPKMKDITDDTDMATLGLTEAEMPRLKESLRQRWPTLIPLVLLISILVTGRTPYLAAFTGITSCAIVGLTTQTSGNHAKNWLMLVVLHAVIAKDGSLQNVRLIGPPSLLSGPVLEAVKSWRYQPRYQNGVAVEVETQITIDFEINAR